jgi:inner membrane protein
MDPLAHTLVGATLAHTALGRRADGSRWPLAAATLVIGANLPDIDVLSYVRGSDFALGFRRGITHGVVAMAVLPALLAAAVLLWDRWRRNRTGGDPAPPRRIWLLAYVAVLSHPLLDWLNVYGVRLLSPFDGRWFYGDALFIIDPWLWLVLGAAVFLARRSGPRRGVAGWVLLAAVATYLLAVGGPPLSSTEGWVLFGLWLAGLATAALLARRPPGRPRRVATVALALVGLYAAGMIAAARAGRGWVERELTAAGHPLAAGHQPGDPYRLMVAPTAVNPLRRQVVARTADGYWLGTLHGLPGLGRLTLTPHGTLAAPPPEPLSGVWEDPRVRGFADWVRFPWMEVESLPGGGRRVSLVDARYATRRGDGFGATQLQLPP